MDEDGHANENDISEVKIKICGRSLGTGQH